MRKFILFSTVLTLAGVFAALAFQVSADNRDGVALASNSLVISQVQMGGTSDANDEFVEIHNNSNAPIDLNGYRIVYRSQNGSSDVANPFALWSASTIIQPGQYMLIASTAYTGGVTPDKTYNPTACSCSMSAANGGVAIRQGDNNTGAIIDSVAWGTVNNGFTEGSPTTAPGNGNSKARALGGCQDTDNNAADFSTLTPGAARNSSTAPNVCAGGGTTLFAAMAANPTAVNPGATTLLTVTVLPATTPPSTGIVVTGDLTTIGGDGSQTFYDDGTHGDVTAGDNKFSFLATVTGDTLPGTKQLFATAADQEGRTAPASVNITVNGATPIEDPLIFGNPSGATADVNNFDNYLIQRTAYTMSYNRTKNSPNWVAWRLDTSWIGGSGRGDFAPDTSLPQGWYQVQPNDYSGSNYDRGHMCPSGDRTISSEINNQTFLMSNIVPQLAANNQGPWADLENYCRTLASQGNELYIISGPNGNIGTIGANQDPAKRIVVPESTWKVVLVLPNGTNDLARASSRATRVFGVIMSNQSISQSAPWRNFRVTVDQVERLTGYDFFSLIPKNTQEIIERRRDRL